MENSNKKTIRFLIIIVLVVAIVSGITGAIYFQNEELKNKIKSQEQAKEPKQEQTKEPKQEQTKEKSQEKKETTPKKEESFTLSNETKEKILSLFGLTLDGLPKIDFESGDKNSKYVSLDSTNIFSYFNQLETNKTIHLEDASKEIKQKIIEKYALKNNLTKEISVYESKVCENKTASERCYTITDETYQKIKRLYNLSNDVYTSSDKEKDYYVFDNSGSIIMPGAAKENISFEVNGATITLIYNLDFKSLDETNVKSFNKEFRFNFELCNCVSGSFNIGYEYFLLNSINITNK